MASLGELPTIDQVDSNVAQGNQLPWKTRKNALQSKLVGLLLIVGWWGATDA